MTLKRTRKCHSKPLTTIGASLGAALPGYSHSRCVIGPGPGLGAPTRSERQGDLRPDFLHGDRAVRSARTAPNGLAVADVRQARSGIVPADRVGGIAPKALRDQDPWPPPG